MQRGDAEFQALSDALREVSPPCTDDPRFLLEAHEIAPAELSHLAMTACRPCPVRALCAAYAASVRPTAGVWAGRTFKARQHADSEPHAPAAIAAPHEKRATMPIHRIEAPTDATTLIGAGRHTDHPGTRIILGIGYTDSTAVASWAAEHGYAVDVVDEIPADYLEQVARLDAYPSELGSPIIDAADPDSRYRVTSVDGHTSVDIRDIINGRTAA